MRYRLVAITDRAAEQCGGDRYGWRKCLPALPVGQEAQAGQVRHGAARLAAVEVVAGDPQARAGHQHVIGAQAAGAAVVARGAGRVDVQRSRPG